MIRAFKCLSTYPSTVDCLITLQGPPSYLSKRIAERGLTINHDVLRKLHGIELENSAGYVMVIVSF